jgi:polyhydroxyalkanoate synthesis repressor PhaR
MKGILIIRKYKNRRLYDTERSIHITRDELIATIRAGRTVQVQDGTSGDDVTVETLFGLFLDAGGNDLNALIPAEFVHFLIRAGEQGLNRFFGEFLPRAMQAFGANLRGLADPQQGAARTMFGMPGYSNPWLPPWMQPPQPGPTAPDQGVADDVTELRSRLKDLEEELGKLRKTRR